MTATIQNLLRDAIKKLSSFGSEARLDAEILLAYALNKDRSYLYARPDKALREEDLQLFLHYVERRREYEPIAYITGMQEFWSLSLSVSHKVLVPRPETELLVEHALAVCANKTRVRIADLGTGSGAIAIAIAHECPDWEIYATDICADALEIAQMNARKFALKNIYFGQGNWCKALPVKMFDMIISNPPYISEAEWRRFGRKLRAEPEKALLASENGLAAYKQIISHARTYLKPNGYLLLEHGYLQASSIQEILTAADFTIETVIADLSSHPRATLAANKSSERSFF